jgi:hypothetical protein
MPIPDNVRTKIQERAKNDEHLREKYLQLVIATHKLLQENEVKYAIIKFIDNPWVMMTDIDILPASPSEELKAVEVLHKKNFRFYEFRFLSDPLKIMAKNPECSDLSVDFYPRLVWIGKRISDFEEVMARIRAKEVCGVKVAVPSPEDDILLIASHAYSHLYLKLPDILHGLEQIYNGNIDWKYVISSCEKNGILHAVYTYLLLLDQYSRVFHGINAVPQEVIASFQCYRVCRRVEKWVESQLETVSFPVKIPLEMGVFLSATYRFESIAKKGELRELSDDLLSHMLMLSSLIVRGFT